MKTKLPKKHGHTWWHNRLDKLLGDWLRDINTECAFCHRPGYLVTSHILPKGRYQGLRYDLMNVLPMHGNCHQFDWHSSPLESGKWFEANYPGRLAYLKEAKKVFIKRDTEYYQRIEEALIKRNIRALMVVKLPIYKP